MIRANAIRVLDRSSIAEVRQEAHAQARALGWDDASAGGAALAATELASNLVKHAQGGVVALSSERADDATRLLLLSVDQGPGMSDIEQCFRDGYSTAGSDGSGLGAVRRQADLLDVISSPAGSVLVAELRRPSDPTTSQSLGLGALAVAKEGQEACGDAWSCRMVDGALAVFASDGLGHGIYAAEASQRAVAAFRGTGWRSAEDAMDAVDAALKPTRGAAAAVAIIDPSSASMTYCGVGNLSASIIVDGRGRHLVSHNGILGHTSPRIASFRYEWPAGAVLVIHSDGITTRWQPAQLGPVWHRHPSLIAGLLYRDHARGNDDAVVLAVKAP